MTNYQRIRNLTSIENKLLYESIEEFGVIIPIIVDIHGDILDGHQRKRITNELGIDCPQTVVTDVDEKTKQRKAISINVARRQLTQSERREYVNKLNNLGMNKSSISKTLGVSRQTVFRDLRGSSNNQSVITGATGVQMLHPVAPNLSDNVQDVRIDRVLTIVEKATKKPNRRVAKELGISEASVRRAKKRVEKTQQQKKEEELAEIRHGVEEMNAGHTFSTKSLRKTKGLAEKVSNTATQFIIQARTVLTEDEDLEDAFFGEHIRIEDDLDKVVKYAREAKIKISKERKNRSTKNGN